jgi:hypothetical protein
VNVTAEQQESFDIATALYSGLRLVSWIRKLAPTIPPVFQATNVLELQTEGVKHVQEIDLVAQRLEGFLANLTAHLTKNKPLIGQYIGHIANTLEDPNTTSKQKLDFVNR